MLVAWIDSLIHSHGLLFPPTKNVLHSLDSFSRIVRLGEGLHETGRLSEAAIARTIDALEVCADKIYRRQAAHVRCVATQACRAASNGEDFLAQAQRRTGLTFEIITPEEEARLAVLGSLDLACGSYDVALVVDVGGGIVLD